MCPIKGPLGSIYTLSVHLGAGSCVVPCRASWSWVCGAAWGGVVEFMGQRFFRSVPGGGYRGDEDDADRRPSRELGVQTDDVILGRAHDSLMSAA